DAILYIEKKFESEIKSGKLLLENENFSKIKKIAEKHGFDALDGILFDLGVSSYQLDKSGRGFSFRDEEDLDMRMSGGSALSAYDVVNKYSEDELVNIISKYGEERKALNIAKKIVEVRQNAKIKTTLQLRELIAEVVPSNGEIHPATKTF